MKRTIAVGVGLLAMAATTATARDAKALGPVDVEIGARAGVASNPSDGPNPLGFGIGARGGIGIASIYLGANVMYYFGSSQGATVLGQDLSVSEHTLMYGLEGGYSIKLLDDVLTIRPQVGVGNATFTASTAGVSGSTSNLYVEPGVVGLVSLGGLFVGGDVNALLIPGVTQPDGSSKTYTSFAVGAQVGLKF